tara:strand:- start:10705 stop:11118 length:414 start_codon:yes stop_codon:yes gene_type:complete
MSEVRDNAMNFEAVKVSMSQNKEGVILRLSVHPNDCPSDLHTDWVGSRYMVAMVKLNDQDEIETRQNEQAIQRLIASCGLLCRELDFQSFLGVDSEDKAVDSIREKCGISSRSEFRDNVLARESFIRIREEYKQWKK